MTDSRRQRWLPYVLKIAELLRRRDWEISISDDRPQSQTALASVWTSHDSDIAIIYFADSFLEEKSEYQRVVVLHELLHVCTARVHDLCMNELPEGAVQRTYVRHMEQANDGLAKAIAPFFPMPYFDDLVAGSESADGPVPLGTGPLGQSKVLPTTTIQRSLRRPIPKGRR